MMDPSLFHMDWERLFEVLVAIVVLAFLIERALSILFESRFFVNRFQGKSLKELIALSIGGLICWYWDFDALSIIFFKDQMTPFGAIITGAVVAGGSKASVKLFRDVLDFRSQAHIQGPQPKTIAPEAPQVQLPGSTDKAQGGVQ